VLSTVPLEIDLARSSERFRCLQLQEPDLVFGGGRCCVDARTGLAAYGPYSAGRQVESKQISVGIIGTQEGIEKTLQLLEEISQPIEQDANIDCILHPSFPGLNVQSPFQVHLVTQSQWHRPLHKRDFRSLEECADPNTKRWLLQEAFGGEVRELSELENPPQVALCAISQPFASILRTEDSDQPANEEILWSGRERSPLDANREFRAGLKAECMGTLLTEIIADQEYSKVGGTQDRPTQAWKLSLALLYKAGLPLWRLANVSQDSCFVGISIYRSPHRTSSPTLKSFAHVVTELGDGFVLDGEAFEWDFSADKDNASHLDEEQAGRLLFRVLDVFKKQTGVSPRKVAVYKRTRYSDAERRGFENILGDIPEYGLMTIASRGIVCMRPGRKPILRGMAIPFDEKLGLVFTSGYIPFLRGYPGNNIPQPLEIIENWGSMSFQRAARDLIRLTKLDLSSPDFSTYFPFTMRHSQKIGDVLQALGRKESSRDDRYYI
jgi:hypothetical protein